MTRIPLPAGHPDYADLASLETAFITAAGGWDAVREKFRSFFRSAIDEVIDTGRSGRLFFHELEKTEKTYLGTKFEIIVRDWLQFPKGATLDLNVGGRDVDVKSTTSGWGWMIPPEAFGHPCLMLKADEQRAKCGVGLFIARLNYLGAGNNRDVKKSITAAGRTNIWWLLNEFDYTPNFWHQVSAADRAQILGAGGGSKRLAYLFERYQQIPISRVQIQAVAQQDDFMKRVRANGGARDMLAPKGIAILYSETDAALIKALGLQVGYREFISYAPANAQEVALLKNAGHLA